MSCGVVAHYLWKGEKICLSPYTSLNSVMLFMFCPNTLFISPRKALTGLPGILSCPATPEKATEDWPATPPKETATAWAARLVPRLGFGYAGSGSISTSGGTAIYGDSARLTTDFKIGA
jgi:hypothetical protein